RIINRPTRGIGKATIDRLRDHARMKGLPLLEAARQAGIVEGLPKKSAVAVAKFVALFDRLSLAVHGAIEEIVGLVLSETGYREVLENSESEEEQDRLANIEDLQTAGRRVEGEVPEVNW